MNNHSKLPNLLEEIRRPSKKSLNKFYSYINLWRSQLFGLWVKSSKAPVPDSVIEMAINQIVGNVLLLDFCRRINESDVKLISFANSLETVTLNELNNGLANSFSCPILRSILGCELDQGIVIPKALFQKNWERAICCEIVLLFGTKPIPLWFFGDYHQLCVANPPQSGARKQRSSETRYARGIHYTPTALVDYLTATSIDAVIEKVPVDRIRVIDPTCGCASFLIAAFRYLVNKQSSTGQQVLDTLKQSIFGVDIDEGATTWSIRLLLLAAKQLIENSDDNLIVPDMRDNIKSGSFLDFQSEKPFDVMLGSPPFVRLSELKRNQPHEVARYQVKFESAQSGQFDLYMLVLEKSIHFLSEQGELGYSISNSFIRSESGRIIRQIIDKKTQIREIVELEDKAVYADAATQIALLRLSKGSALNTIRYVHIDGKKNSQSTLKAIYHKDPADNKNIEIRYHPKEVFQKSRWNLRPSGDHLTKSGIPISDLPIKIFQGVSSPLDQIFMLKDKGFRSPDLAFGETRDGREVKFEREMIRPIVRGRNTTGFIGSTCKNVMVFPYTKDHKVVPDDVLRQKYPLTHEYLESVRPNIKANISRGPWYKFRTSGSRPASPTQILCSKITSARGFSFIENNRVLLHTGVFGCSLSSILNPYAVLATLNSSVFWDYIIARMPTYGDGCRSIRMPAFKEFKLPRAILNTPLAVAERCEKLVKEIRRSLLRKQTTSFRELCKDLDAYVEELYNV